MISFEVGAVFSIEDLASGTIAELSERMEGLAAATEKVQEGLGALGSIRFSELQTELATLDQNLAAMARSATAAGDAMRAAAGQGEAAFNAAAAAAGRAAEAYEAAAARMATAIAAGGGRGGGGDDEIPPFYTGPPRIGYSGGGSGGGRGGSPPFLLGGPLGGGGGGGGGSALTSPANTGWTAGGPGIPINLGGGGGGGGPHFGLGEMLEVGTIYDALHQAMDEDLSILRTEQALGIDPKSALGMSAALRLRQAARSASDGTIYSEKATAGAMPILARELGFKGQEGIDKFGKIFPTALQSAEVAENEHLGGLDDTLSANMEYAHLTGRYDPKELEAGLNQLQAISTAVSLTPRQEESVLKYAIPAGITAGMGADETAMTVGFLQQQGLRGSTAGTGLANLIRRTMQTDGGDKQMTALHDLGIDDAQGNKTVLDAHGHLDFQKVEDRIHAYASTHSDTDTLGVETRAFGVYGGRVAGFFNDPDMAARRDRFAAGIKATPGAAELQGQMAERPMQHFEQAVARSSDLLNTLATAILPQVDAALQTFTGLITGANAYFQSHPAMATVAGDAGVGATLGAVFGGGAALLGGAGIAGGMAAGAGAGAAVGVAFGLYSAEERITDAIGSRIYGKDEWAKMKVQDDKASKGFWSRQWEGLQGLFGTPAHAETLAGQHGDGPHAIQAPSVPAAITINIGPITLNGVADDIKGQVSALFKQMSEQLAQALAHSTGGGYGSLSAPPVAYGDHH